MKINLTKKQYECLIKAIEAGSSVYGILGDTVADYYKPQSIEIENLQDYFLNFAHDFGMENITEEFQGNLITSNDYSEQMEEAMDDYNNETFWNELQVRLGKRDFSRTMTALEEKEIKENGGWLPDRIHGIYDEWEKEFEEHGIERLEVKKD